MNWNVTMKGEWQVKMENFIYFHGTWEQAERQFISLTIINFAKNSIAFLLQERFAKAVEFLLKRSIWVETIVWINLIKNHILSGFFTYGSNAYLTEYFLLDEHSHWRFGNYINYRNFYSSATVIHKNVNVIINWI